MLYYRNEIQALDYSETMLFAMKESGAHKIVAKISKQVIILLYIMFVIYSLPLSLSLSLCQVCCQYFPDNYTIWVLFSIFCIYRRNPLSSELIIIVYIVCVIIFVCSQLCQLVS